MGSVSVGQVVLARFPFSDLTSQKVRPCLVIGIAEFDDIIVCQITSKPYSSKRAIPLKKNDFSEGRLVVDSYIRPDKIATLDMQMITEKPGTLNKTKMSGVKEALKSLFEMHHKEKR